jgi:hypothetical protein
MLTFLNIFVKKPNPLKKYTRKSVFLFSIAVVLFATTMVHAYNRLSNPTMDYVPQNVGIYDTYYENFKEPDCRACHGTSTVERHHGTVKAQQGYCSYCHTQVPGIVPPETDCKTCHIDDGPLGDLGLPHHNTYLSDTDKCTACHDPDLVCETDTCWIPTYVPTNISPTPYSCENCHWPSGNAPHTATTVTGSAADFQTDWTSWAGLPLPSHGPSGVLSPAPIEANGPMFSGNLWNGGMNYQRPTPWYMPAKAFQPMDGTHHETGGNVYPKCYKCHGTNPTTDPSWNPTNLYLIRYCERCHDTGTLHGIAEHVTSDNIYRVGGNADQTVDIQGKCIVCHGDVLLTFPLLPDTVPKIATMEPDFGSAGTDVHLTPRNAGSFGSMMAADRVLVGQSNLYTGCGGIEYVEMPIDSWTENEIQFSIPGSTFDPGNLCVKIQKQTQSGVRTSPVFSKKFSLRERPKIDYLNPSVGILSSSPIKIKGNAFGVKSERVYADGYGYSTYVEFHASNDKYRATKYLDPDGVATSATWSDNKIKIKLMDNNIPPNYFLFDINTSTTLTDPAQLFRGCWETYVITDFFRDDGDGVYFKAKDTDPVTGPLGTLDPGDELISRTISDPVCFYVTDNPIITSIKPSKLGSNDQVGKVLHGNVVRLYGLNFGPVKQALDRVDICNNSACSTYTSVPTNRWTDTLIKFTAPAVGGYPATKWVRVHVHAAAIQDSNVKKLIIK